MLWKRIFSEGICRGSPRSFTCQTQRYPSDIRRLPNRRPKSHGRRGGVDDFVCNVFLSIFFETSKWHLAYATDGEAVKNRCLFLGQGVFQGSRAAGGSVGVVVPDLSPRRLSCRNVGLLFKSTHLSAGWQPLKRRILVEGQGLREVRLRRR